MIVEMILISEHPSGTWDCCLGPFTFVLYLSVYSNKNILKMFWVFFLILFFPPLIVSELLMAPILAPANCSCCVADGSNGDQIGSFFTKDFFENKVIVVENSRVFPQWHVRWSKMWSSFIWEVPVKPKILLHYYFYLHDCVFCVDWSFLSVFLVDTFS